MTHVLGVMKRIATLMPFGLLASVGENVGAPPAAWPPSECDVERKASTEGFDVDIVIGGMWGNSCVPYSMALRVDDYRVELALTICDSGLCQQTFTPWSLTRSTGPLSQGVYSVLVIPVGCHEEILGSEEGLCQFVVSDDDGDVDLMDYQIMSACLESQGGALWSGCELYDEDLSGQVDLADFAEFQVFFTGEGA